MNELPHLLGYEIVEQIYEGNRTLLYRGVRQSDSLPIVIKLLKNPFPSFKELAQFRNQYAIAKDIDSPYIIKMMAIEPYKNVYAIVMEDFSGISLREILCRAGRFGNNPHTLNTFIKIAIQITEALDGLYAHRIIHNDLKPENILVDRDRQQIKLIDFSTASHLTHEKQELQSREKLKGTLSYLAPERTGRMECRIDYRSDFYSLGITFYEMLTGNLPFIAADSMTLVYYHLAKSPIPVYQINRAVPQILSEIVSKLMAKNAEDRYKTAIGIKHDLEKILELTTGDSFELGQGDSIDHFLIPDQLYGREVEVAKLLAAFDRTSHGSTEILLVTGYSGIGKTAVVNQVHKPIVRQQGYFIKGKYDQFQKEIPFLAFVQAFRDLMGQLLAESDSQMQRWKERILEAVGVNGQVLIEVIPELEYIIGVQPPVSELSGNAAENRFNHLIQRFVQVFTTANHPLVLFLDDLQWMDSASLNLLKLLMQNQTHLLILGAYRDNEVSPNHPLILVVNEITKTGITVNTIALQPLTEKDINQLIADTLLCELFQAQLLTACIYPKTQGNPFFTTQFLKTLYEDGLITFDVETKQWQWSFVKIAFLFSDNVIDLMVQKLQKLPTETQDSLKLASCIGNQFDLVTLAIVSKRSQLETAVALCQAQRLGLIVPQNQSCKLLEADAEFRREQDLGGVQNYECCYQFFHDRVQQAAYSLIPESQKGVLHLQVGRRLLEQTSASDRDLQIFHIVNHFNQGADLIVNEAEQQQIAHLNWLAAKKARKSSAYSSAMNYLDMSLQFLSTHCWRTQYALSLEIYQLTAELSYLMGDYERMSQLVEIGLQQSQNHLDRAKFYEIQIMALTAQNQFQSAITLARNVLLNFGVRFPNNLFKLRTILGFLITVYRVSRRSHKDLLALPMMTDPHKLAICSLFNVIGAVMQVNQPEIAPFITFIAISLYLRYGNIPKSSMAYTIYAYLLCDKLGQIDAGYAMGKMAIAPLLKILMSIPII